jgi:hypothetical protein
VQLGGDQTADVTIDKQGFAFKINSEGDVNRFAVLGTNQIQIGNYGGNVFPGDDATYALGVDVDGNVVELPLTSGPLVYIGKVTGNGPTASITQIFNNTGATITFGQFITGQYVLSASSAVFTANKTGVFITPVIGPAFVDVNYFTSDIYVNTYNASGVAADLVANIVIKVEIYP